MTFDGRQQNTGGVGVNGAEIGDPAFEQRAMRLV